ncbi:hypothetical protein F0726_00046 [Acidithiobacillus caldus]|nr:hypothetical protein F0726_00046 [Acidithiobacillus caldus]
MGEMREIPRLKSGSHDRFKMLQRLHWMRR